MALTFRSCVAFAHECTDPGRSNPGEQDRHENYRSCGSSRHFRKLYLRLYETRKLAQEHGDHLRRWSIEHRTRLKRWSDDQKYEQSLIPAFAERRERAAAKYRKRMDSACHQIAAQLANYAARLHFAAVRYDDSEHAFCDEFPWAKLRTLLDQKLNAYGIELQVAKAANNPNIQLMTKARAQRGLL